MGGSGVPPSGALGPEPRSHPLVSAGDTGCCVVGGGPAGVTLALLLARRGLRVTLLEMHHDFNRDLRGDTLMPSTLEIMEELGLAERLLELPHSKLRRMEVETEGSTDTLADFGHLRSRHPYVVLMPQALFLEFLATEARGYPSFDVRFGATAMELVTVAGAVRGVRYQAADGWHEVRAPLTVGADGRFSRLRHLGGFSPIPASPPMDVLWFRLPRVPGDPGDSGFHTGGGRLLILLDRGEQWQLGLIVGKGSYQGLRASGLQALRQTVVDLLPYMADRVGELAEWQQIALLSVEANRLRRWWRDGLLLIGDAAHVMSPVGGVGINYAIQDAVATANRLAQPLLDGHVRNTDLAAVQARREWPLRLIQAFQALLGRRVLAPAVIRAPHPAVRLPTLLRWGFLRAALTRFIAYGVRRERVCTTRARPVPTREVAG